MGMIIDDVAIDIDGRDKERNRKRKKAVENDEMVKLLIDRNHYHSLLEEIRK